MASYQQFAERIGEGRVVSAYTKLLTDINYCINVFEHLETGRTVTERFSDWSIGERNQIDGGRFRIALNTLKQEVELGMKLYIDLTFKMKDLKDMQTFQESRPQPETHSGGTPRWGTQQELRFQFEQLITAIEHIVIPDKTQPRHKLFTRLQEMGSYYEKSDLNNRAKMYETVKILYLTLNQNEVFDVLRANHATVIELILSIDPNADIPCIPVPQEVRKVSQETKRTDNKTEKEKLEIPASSEPDVEQKEGNSAEAMKTSQENTHECKSMEDGIEIARTYYETKIQELENLASSEPDMDQKMRDRMAIKMAVTACKTFLKAKFNFSNSEADELVMKEFQ